MPPITCLESFPPTHVPFPYNNSDFSQDRGNLKFLKGFGFIKRGDQNVRTFSN